MDVPQGYIMKKIMMFLVATNVVASRLPEHQPKMASWGSPRLRQLAWS